MGTTCDRMGCSSPATVVFGADPRRMIVVMEPVDPTTLGALRPGILCTEHADRLTVPRGWTLDDRREPTPRLFRLPVTPMADHRGRTARPAVVAPGYEQPMLTVVVDEPETIEPETIEPVTIEPVTIEPVTIEPVVDLGPSVDTDQAEAPAVDVTVVDAPVEPVPTLAIEWDERDPVAVPLVDDDLDADLDDDLDAGDWDEDVSDAVGARELEYVADPDLDPDPSWPVVLDDTGGVDVTASGVFDTERWRGDHDGRPR